MTDRVDVVILTRGDADLDAAVEQGLAVQGDLLLQVHRVVAPPEPGDSHRWQTIARGRNRGKRLGHAPWLMFLDDDVVLPPDCIPNLLHGLDERPIFAALAADYLGECLPGRIAPHVSMGATLFRRAALDAIEFRCTGSFCECLCACDDLRSQWMAIDYLAGQTALHLPRAHPCRSPAHASSSAEEHSGPQAVCSGIVLAAFDDCHAARFRDQFVASLRQRGNHERIIAVGYGLSERESLRLDQIEHLTVVHRPAGEVSPAVRRLSDFQAIVEPLPDDTPVAYWDAGDVVFQGSLAPLWQLVGRYPRQLLVVAEPLHHPLNPSVTDWTQSIADEAARQAAFGLLSTNLCLNSGFAASTAQTMLTYFRAAAELLNSSALRGTTDWGDQTALNLYCHSRPQAWRQIDDGWNYCLCGRSRAEAFVGEQGVLVRRSAKEIRVIHGNAQTLPTLQRAALAALPR